jgi:membrane protein
MGRQRLKILLRTVYLGFKENTTQLHSANLTYYTLFSIVPIFALLLTISEYFHFQNAVERWLLLYFSEQPEVANYLVTFAHHSLKDTQSLIVKVVGILLLLWAAIKMLLYIDISLNQIWNKTFRPKFLLRNARFLIMLLICPVLFLIASGVSLYLSAFLRYISEQGYLLNKLSHGILITSKIFPSLITFLLLSFLYYFVPYVKVSIKYALITGLITSMAYQLIQYGFFSLQISVSSYSSIYGTFSAFPLFLAWIHLSWVIFLIGGKFCFALHK